MALVVESGSGLATAESYFSVVDFRNRVLALGLEYLKTDTPTADWIMDATETEVEAALRRGTIYVDGRNNRNWLGYRAVADQALDWPRAGVPGEPRSVSAWPYGGTAYSLGSGAYGYTYGRLASRRLRGFNASYYRPTLASDVIPARVLTALAHAAARELNSPGSLTPDSLPSQVVARETVGPISVEYAQNITASPLPVLQVVEDLLAPLLDNAGGAVRIMRA